VPFQLFGLLIAVAAGACFAAETYKWVDENGVVNYGEKPPGGRPSRLVDTNLSGTIETGGRYDQRPDAGKGRQAEGEHRPRIIAVPLPAPALSSVRGMDFDTFIRLQRGMTEGELLVRAGRADHETVDNLYDYDRTLYYFPTIANPYTTVVKLRSGRIAQLDRVKKF
jgi:hypothetical protein